MLDDQKVTAAPQRAPTSPRPFGLIDGLLASLGGVLSVAVLLLLPAGLVPGGTWLWPQGLWFVGVTGAISLAGNGALAVARPEHFGVRQQSVVASKEKQQPLIDAVGSAGLIAFSVAWLIFIPVDVFRLHLLPAPSPALSIVGGVCVVIAELLTFLAVWENKFATPNLQQQNGQKVIDTGIYSFIRHPIYAGTLLRSGGIPLWLGSSAAFFGVGVVLVATVGRILIEEAHLRANVPGYEDYARRVRGRVIPFVL